jgi:hypothetical protein
MTGNTRWVPILLLATPLALLLLASCTDEGDGGSGGGDPVYSTREGLEAGPGGAGGVGGAGPDSAAEPIRICAPDVVVLDGLPECFVAEVSSEPLDCTAPGHEELRESWADAARERECAYRSLNATECAALSLCGLVKATGSAQAACQAADPDAPAGYCTVNQGTDGCPSAAVDSLFVYGVSPGAEALHVSCAIVGSD